LQTYEVIELIEAVYLIDSVFHSFEASIPARYAAKTIGIKHH
jgi:hypothetical protein